jgi:hypothetical protein
MSAASTIPPNQIAAAILFLYAGAAVLFWRRSPAPIQPTRRKPVQSVPRHSYTVKLQPEPVLTFLDVDLTECDREERQYILQRCNEEQLLDKTAQIVSRAKGLTVSDKDLKIFWEIRQELLNRQIRHEN